MEALHQTLVWACGKGVLVVQTHASPSRLRSRPFSAAPCGAPQPERPRAAPWVFSPFLAHLYRAAGTRARCASRVWVHPQTLVLHVDGPWRPLRALRGRTTWVGSSVSLTPPIRAPCKPGMGKGVSHSSSFPQGAGGSEGRPSRAHPLVPSEQHARPPSRGICGSGKTPPQCWGQAGWFQELWSWRLPGSPWGSCGGGGHLQPLFPPQLQESPRMGWPHTQELPGRVQTTVPASLRGQLRDTCVQNAEGSPAGHPPCPPWQREGAHPHAHEAPRELRAASWPDSILVLSPKSLFFQTLSKSVLIHQKRS